MQSRHDIGIRVYPNPFNPVTTIAFALARAGNVTLDIYGVQGRVVRRLVSEHLPRGAHEVNWNGSDDGGHAVSTGVYFVRLVAGEKVLTRRIVLLK